MNMKVLSPAGDMESLKVAVYNGADEIYLGVKDFNARNIEGFSLETLKQAVDFAHVFGVKVNLTVNILFDDIEIRSALDLIVDAYNLGVDAFIIQDIGLASLVHEYYPQIEMHASTQMAIHNLEGVKVVERLGFKRVVLARETPIAEIKRIKENSNIEIEYFCQGALCVCFSGNCYMSSYLFDASGNRGKCKQLCRLPYTLKLDNKELKHGYLLSAKDFNMLDNLKDLQEAGVDVLKIEGRARRPYYVGVATRIYKQALNNENYNIEDLKLAFNRGYTAGYFNGNGNIISNKQNHIGIEIGKVEKFLFGKKFNEVYISSNMEISPKSVLKFIVDDEETVLTAYDIKKVDNLYRITTTQKVKVGSSVNLISDFEKEQSMLNFKIKRKLDIYITAKQDEEITAKFVLNGETHTVKGGVCCAAKNQPITEEDLKLNFSKSDLFDASLYIEMDNIFMPKQMLNEFRRNTFEKIYEVLTKIKKEKLNKILLKLAKNNKKFNNFIEIDNNFKYFFEKNKNIKQKNIIYNPNEFKLEDIKEFILICEKNNKNPYLSLPTFALCDDIKMLKHLIEETRIPVVVNNFYALDFDAEKVIGAGLNIFNDYSANYFNLPYICAEGDEFKMPYMTLRHCPMKCNLGASCYECPYKDGFEYIMQNGQRLKLKRQKMSTCTFFLVD